MACPKKVLKLDMGRLNIRGYHPSTVASPEKCVACAMCAMMCPDSAITVEKEAN
ncbi:MAG: 4Fe-4S binding protein [Clostridiales bacterium]|nr:4Fe-4S binding protein [Clostridiales bacterium]